MSTAAPLSQPRSFGRYELVHMLAQGGMGEVYLAKLTGAAGFEKLCIVKTILQKMSADKQFVERFHHEARVLVQLTHASIAQVYDMGEIDSSFYMAMEYIAGVDLARIQDRVSELKHQVPVGIALYMGQKISEALGYAHRKIGSDGAPLGIVHRDISPQNVMVSYEGEVKVIDFGLAKSAARSKHTQPSTVLGKLGYMSPEQARGEPVDYRSDIFSCGVVIWELLTGRALFLGETVGEMVAQMSNPKVPSLRSIRPEVSEAVERVLLRALATNPAERYTRADDLARALNELLVRDNGSIGAEEVGNYVRGLCPEEFVEQRRLISRLSTLGKRTSDAAAGTADDGFAGTAIRQTATPHPGEALSGTAIRAGATPHPSVALSGAAIRPGATPRPPAGAGIESPPAAETGRPPAPIPLSETVPPRPDSIVALAPKSRAPLFIALALVVALAAGGAAVIFKPKDESPPPSAPTAAGPVSSPQEDSPKVDSARADAAKMEAGETETGKADALKRETGAAPESPTPSPAPAKPTVAGKAERSSRPTTEVGKVYELFVDRGDHFVRAGTSDGLSRGARVVIVAKGTGSTREVIGEGTVMQTWPHMARLAVDAETQGAKEPLFGSFETRPLRRGPRPARNQDVPTAPPPGSVAAAAPPAPTPNSGAQTSGSPAPPPGELARPEAPKGEPMKAPDSPGMRGRAFLSGVGPFRRVNVENNSNVPWTYCDARLPTNQHFMFDSIPAGESDGALLRKFTQDGVERDVPIDSVTVKCRQGSAKFQVR